MKKKYYLAYGSNLNMDQMAWRCPSATAVGTAELKGWRLEFQGSGSGAYLTIVPDEFSSAPLGVWRITEADERSLDRYEGFPHFYYKQNMKVEVLDLKNGRPRSVSALIYIMRDGRPLGVPGQSYVQTCLEGCEDFGLDASALYAALNRAAPERW